MLFSFFLLQRFKGTAKYPQTTADYIKIDEGISTFAFIWKMKVSYNIKNID